MRVGEVLEVLAQLPRRLAPREVGVRLVEADLGQPLHHPRAGERLGEEDRLGVLARIVAITHSQKANALVCGLSTRKIVTPGVDPEADDVGQAVPQALPVGALEVQRVDVLVLLRRVLGVLDRAVGAVGEPLRVLGDPRVVGRALERDVERQLDAAVAGRRAASLATSSTVPSSGCTAVCPPSGAADGPRAAGVVGRRRGRVVAALALGHADRVDRRQVQHVEAHRGDVVEAVDGVERACRARSPGRASSGGRTRTSALKRARSGSTSMSTGRAQLGDGLADAGAPEQGVEVEAARAPARRRRGRGRGRRRGAARPRTASSPRERVSPAARRSRRARRAAASVPLGPFQATGR